MTIFDPVTKPEHYNTHPSGVECIEITRHLNYNLGNAFKYLFRMGKKGDPVMDVEKALFYVRDEKKRPVPLQVIPIEKRLGGLSEYRAFMVNLTRVLRHSESTTATAFEHIVEANFSANPGLLLERAETAILLILSATKGTCPETPDMFKKNTECS